MKRFHLRSWKMQFDWPAVKFFGYPMALGVVLIASHGDYLGAILTGLGCFATILVCAMDWSH
jgi:hypothetical protein